MPRQDIATRVYHGSVQPFYSMVPAGLPGHTDAYKALYGASPSVAKAKAVLKKAGLTTPIPITIWWTPSHYGDASADEFSEIQRSLNASGLFKVTLKSAEWAQYSAALGKQYGAFQLGWFPDYPDAEDYTVSFYQPGAFYNNGYCEPRDDEADRGGAGGTHHDGPPHRDPGDAGTGCAGRCRRSRTGRAR